jgi:sigma-E factor negative regulatory protein RseA
LLDELRKDDELGQTFSRYALIGEAMRSGANGQRLGQGSSLLSRIQAELEEEPAYNQIVLATPASKNTRSYKMGMGIAATVATVAVCGWLFTQGLADKATASQQVASAPATTVQTVASLPVPAVQTPPANEVQVAEVDTRIRQIGRVDSQTRDILKQYVAQHVKYASTTAIAPSIRAVAYSNER